MGIREAVLPGGWRALAAALVAGWLSGCAMEVRPYPYRRAVVAEPRLVLIEGTDVYACPDLDEDVFFYDHQWYVYRADGWYCAPRYGGPWTTVVVGRLPTPFIQVPPERFKRVYGQSHPAHEHHPDLDHWDMGNRPTQPPPENRGRGWGRGGRDDQGQDGGDRGNGRWGRE